MSEHTIDTRRALTVKQPWAHLIITGHKKTENRTWPTRYRGRLYIHAGTQIDESAIDDLPDSVVTDHAELHRLGGIIGHVDLIGCDRDDTADPYEMQDHWHWRLANPTPVPFEKCRGALGIWQVGNQKRVVELPAGWTMKTTRDIPTEAFRTTLLRDGIKVATFDHAERVGSQALAAEHALKIHALPALDKLTSASECNCAGPCPNDYPENHPNT